MSRTSRCTLSSVYPQIAHLIRRENVLVLHLVALCIPRLDVAVFYRLPFASWNWMVLNSHVGHAPVRPLSCGSFARSRRVWCHYPACVVDCASHLSRSMLAILTFPSTSRRRGLCLFTHKRRISTKGRQGPGRRMQ